MVHDVDRLLLVAYINVIKYTHNLTCMKALIILVDAVR